MGFEPTISAGERPHTYAIDLAATGIGKCCLTIWKSLKWSKELLFVQVVWCLSVRLDARQYRVTYCCRNRHVVVVLSYFNWRTRVVTCPARLPRDTRILFFHYLRLPNQFVLGIFPHERTGRCVRLTIHIHLVIRQRISGAIPTHTHTHTLMCLHGVHRDNVAFTLSVCWRQVYK